MTDLAPTDPYIDIADEFWASTALDRSSNERFVRRLRLARPELRTIHPLASAAAPVALEPVDDRFQRRLALRRSRRSFADAPLTEPDLARLLAAVGVVDGRRVVPSAGGLDSVTAFVIARNVEGAAGGQVLRFDPSGHTLSPVGPAPSDDDLRTWCNLDPDIDDALPAGVIVLVADLRPIRRKYGTRGDRFALIETGCALEHLELRSAHDRLASYQLGGVREELAGVLRLPHPDVRITGALAVGQRRGGRRRGRWSLLLTGVGVARR